MTVEKRDIYYPIKGDVLILVRKGRPTFIEIVDDAGRAIAPAFKENGERYPAYDGWYSPEDVRAMQDNGTFYRQGPNGMEPIGRIQLRNPVVGYQTDPSKYDPTKDSHW